MTSPESSALRLAPPGAGLPPAELFVARLLFSFRARLSTRRSVERAIRTESPPTDPPPPDGAPEFLAQRVLIKRPRGLEDSSRYWSVLMTLDHLRIVNFGVATTIRELLAGRRPRQTVSTAALKPSPDVDANVHAHFAASC